MSIVLTRPSETDIRVAFQILETEADASIIRLVDDYTFSSTGRFVHNVIESHIRFREGLIVSTKTSVMPVNGRRKRSAAYRVIGLGEFGGFEVDRSARRCRERQREWFVYVSHHV